MLQNIIAILYQEILFSGFPGGSVVKNLPAIAGDGFDPWVRKIAWSRKWQPTAAFLRGKFHGLEEPGGL